MTHILITGASSGLGAALARAYAAPGVRLCLWGRDRERLDKVAAECRAAGAAAQIVALDLQDLHSIEPEIERCDRENPVDIAIFNAGLGGVTPKERVVEGGRRALEVASVNFTAAAIGASTIAERMVARGRGQIVLVSSVAQSIPLPMSPAYAGSKAGLRMFAESLRLRLIRHGISVTLAAPGFIDTPMSRQVAAAKPFMITPEKGAAILKRAIAQRRGDFSFPLPYALLERMFLLLPRPLRRTIASRMPSS